MNLRNLSRLIFYGSFILVTILILLIYWLNSNHLKVDSIQFGPVSIESLDLKLSKGFQSKKLSARLGKLDISLSEVSINWNQWWFLLGNFDSVFCKEVIFSVPDFDKNNPSTKTDSKSLINYVLTRRLNIEVIKVDSLKSINSELEAESITASLSGSQLRIQGSNFNMRSKNNELLSAPRFKGKFHFPTNRLVLEDFQLHHNQLGNLIIKDLDIPINLRPGVSISCREVHLDSLDQILRDFKLNWKDDNTYQASFRLKKNGNLTVSRIVFNQKLDLKELRFNAQKFEVNFNLLRIDTLLKNQLSKLISSLPSPLATGEIFPEFTSDETLKIKLDGKLYISQNSPIKNKVNLEYSLNWTSSDSRNILIAAQFQHSGAKLDYEIIPLEIIISENGLNIWQTTFSTKVAFIADQLILKQFYMNKFDWKDKFSVTKIKSNEFNIDSKLNISGLVQFDSVNIHKVLTSGPTDIELNGLATNIHAKINLENLSVLDFGTAKTTQADAQLNDGQLYLNFDIQDYSKNNSFSSNASGSLTWSPNFSEGLIKINTGSISLADYIKFDSSDEVPEKTSAASYHWTIEGQTNINDDQLQGNTRFRLVFDHRLDGPSGSAELESGVLKLAGNKFTLIEPARLRLFPKPKAIFEDELLWTVQSQNKSQSPTEQLQAMWDASNPNNEKYYEHGIWIQIMAGVKFRGEDVEIKISGKYPSLRFRLNSLSGKSDEELLNSFLGSLQNKLGNQSPDTSSDKDQYKHGANLLVGTLIDSFFGSVFNNFGTQFHTKIGDSEQSSLGIQQPLGDNLSVGLTQGKEGNIQTKSKNFELQFQPGSSIKFENIEKDGYQNETQVEIQKRFRF